MGEKDDVPDNAATGVADVNWITISSDKLWNSDGGITTTTESIILKPYKLSKVTFKGFVFIQKGKYLFNIDLGVPSNLTIKESQLIFDTNLQIKTGIEYTFDSYDSSAVATALAERAAASAEPTKKTNNMKMPAEFHKQRGLARVSKFYKYSAQYYILNDTKLDVNITFNLNVNYKSLDGTVTRNNVSLNDLSYCGTQIYADNKITNFWNKFSKIKTFQDNTSDDFAELKEYLTPKTGRGNDFWNLILIQDNIDSITSTISSQAGLLESQKELLKDKYNYIINGIDGLDYKETFLNNRTYFDNPEIVFKQNVNISTIFTNSDTSDSDINTYITYEKIRDISLRTPLIKNDVNFDALNNSEKFIYVLKDSIDIENAAVASF